MAITTDDIKKLRDETGVSVMECKRALEEAEGDAAKARVILRKKSAAAAAKKADRNLGAGRVASYVHATGTVAAMVELRSETDFVAKTEEFRKLAYDIAMHVTAMSPAFVKPEDVSAEDIARAKAVFEKEAEGKPEEIKGRIVEGKLKDYLAERCLLTQPFFKTPEVTIGAMIEQAIQKFGERVEVARFVRYDAA